MFVVVLHQSQKELRSGLCMGRLLNDHAWRSSNRHSRLVVLRDHQRVVSCHSGKGDVSCIQRNLCHRQRLW